MLRCFGKFVNYTRMECHSIYENDRGFFAFNLKNSALYEALFSIKLFLFLQDLKFSWYRSEVQSSFFYLFSDSPFQDIILNVIFMLSHTIMLKIIFYHLIPLNHAISTILILSTTVTPV